jgi:hypothetical protein
MSFTIPPEHLELFTYFPYFAIETIQQILNCATARLLREKIDDKLMALHEIFNEILPNSTPVSNIRKANKKENTENEYVVPMINAINYLWIESVKNGLIQDECKEIYYDLLRNLNHQQHAAQHKQQEQHLDALIKDIVDRLTIKLFENDSFLYNFLQNELRQTSFEYLHYGDFQWRFEIVVSQRTKLYSVQPTFLLELSTENKNIQTNSINNQSAVHVERMQTDVASLQHISDVLDRAIKDMSSKHVGRVMRYVK